MSVVCLLHELLCYLDRKNVLNAQQAGVKARPVIGGIATRLTGQRGVKSTKSFIPWPPEIALETFPLQNRAVVLTPLFPHHLINLTESGHRKPGSGRL